MILVGGRLSIVLKLLDVKGKSVKEFIKSKKTPHFENNSFVNIKTMPKRKKNNLLAT
jgi:hypothetical protein